MSEPTELWGLWHPEKGWLCSREVPITYREEKNAVQMLDAFGGAWAEYRPVRLVPAGSEREVVLRVLREQRAAVHLSGAWDFPEVVVIALDEAIEAIEKGVP